MDSVIPDPCLLPKTLILLPIWHFCNFKDHNSSPNLLFNQVITKHLRKHLNAMRCAQGGKAHLYSLTTSKPKTLIKSKLLLCDSPELCVGAWQVTKEGIWGASLKVNFSPLPLVPVQTCSSSVSSLQLYQCSRSQDISSLFLVYLLHSPSTFKRLCIFYSRGKTLFGEMSVFHVFDGM